MKYLDEFRDGQLAQGLAARIRQEADPTHAYALTEFAHMGNWMKWFAS